MVKRILFRRRMTHINHHQRNSKVSCSKAQLGECIILHHGITSVKTSGWVWEIDIAFHRVSAVQNSRELKNTAHLQLPAGAHAESKIVRAICISCHLPVFYCSLGYTARLKALERTSYSALTPVWQPITYLHPVSCVRCVGGY